MRFAVLLILCVVLIVGFSRVEAKKKKIPPWHIRMAQRQGPNACAVEEVPDSNKRFYTECKYWMHRKICGRKTIIRYECCEGYDRVPGEHGCTGVKPLINLLATAEDLGATIFAQYVREAGLAGQFSRSGAATLFAPTNAAFETISPAQKTELVRSFNNPKSPLLLYHLIPRRVHSNDFQSDLLAETMHPGHKIRLNKYSNGLMTANCVPVLRKDQEASNGIVHLIDSLLMPEVPRNIFDSIVDDGRFEELVRMMRETGIAEQVRALGSFTVLTPSDEEFTKIPRAKRQQLRNNPEARKVLSQNHIIPHTICLAAIVDEHKLTTLNGDELNFHCNETGVYVGGSRLLGESLSGTNGVAHVVSEIIAPDRAKSIWDLAAENGLDTFSQMARKTGLEAQLDNYGDVTIFAFSDDAFKEQSVKEQERLLQDTQAARELLRFHIAPGRFTRDRITDDQRIQSLDGRNSLRLRVYRRGCGVESAIITKMDIQGMNGVVHVIDRVLEAPTNNVLDLLQNDGNYSIIAEAIQKVRTVDPSIIDTSQWNGGTMTFFAPSDQAFRKLGRDNLRRVMGNTTYLTKVLKNHIVENMISSGSFKTKLHYNVQTKQNMVEVRKQSHAIRVNNAMVMKPDLVTKEGIVHMVDSVLMPENGERRHQQRHG